MGDHDLNSYRVAERLAPILAAVSVTAEDVMTLPAQSWKLAVQVYVANQRNPYRPEYVPDPTERWEPQPGYMPSEKTRRFVKALLTETPAPAADPFAGLPGADG